MNHINHSIQCSLVVAISVAAFPHTTRCQVATGGSYRLEQTVVGNGGDRSSGGLFVITGTMGQGISGTSSSGGRFVGRGGFWQPAEFAPTAASVSVSGRAISALGDGIPQVEVTLIDFAGHLWSARTSSMGHYTFDNVPAGETYVISVSSKRFSFAAPSRVVFVLDELTDVDFIGQPNPD